MLLIISALEIYTNNHKSYLFDFYPLLTSQILADLQTIVKLNTKRAQTIPPNLFFSQFTFTQDWVNGKTLE